MDDNQWLQNVLLSEKYHRLSQSLNDASLTDTTTPDFAAQGIKSGEARRELGQQRMTASERLAYQRGAARGRQRLAQITALLRQVVGSLSGER